MKKDKTVLITGATSGIGYELTKLFAHDKYSLVLVARNQAKLEEMAREFKKRYDIFVKIIVADLAKPSAPKAIVEQLSKDGIEIEVLINNAGFGGYGPFIERDLKDELDMIQVNISSLVALTHLLAPTMVAKGHGRILNVASTASFFSGPLMAVYYATKNFVLSFSEAIANELRGTGVSVTTLCPGPTRTGFQERAEMEDSKLMAGNITDAIQVAQAAYQGLMNGENLVFVGQKNKLAVNLPRLLPRSIVTAMVRKIQEEKK